MGAHKFKGYPTCFSYAIKSNCSAKAIRALLRSGIEADSRDFWGRTPLAIAAREGRTDIVEMLLKVDGVNVNSRCCEGRTPFMFAALTGHADVVRLLL
ncbi:ankyrin, partial [Choiromyces venosus 120613-1]